MGTSVRKVRCFNCACIMETSVVCQKKLKILKNMWRNSGAAKWLWTSQIRLIYAIVTNKPLNLNGNWYLFLMWSASQVIAGNNVTNVLALHKAFISFSVFYISFLTRLCSAPEAISIYCRLWIQPQPTYGVSLCVSQSRISNAVEENGY